MSRTIQGSEPSGSKRKHVISSASRHDIITVFQTLKRRNEQKVKKESETTLICEVSDLFQRCYPSVRSIIEDHKAGRPIVTPKRQRMRQRPVRGVDDFTKEAIARYIHKRANEGKAVTGKEVWQHVKDNWDTYFFSGSYSSFYKILKDMGYVWKKGDRYAHIQESEAVYIKRQYFLIDFLKNKNSENPKPVVYLDETWIYVNGTTTYSWVNPNDKSGHVRRRPEGGRLVILHAGTKAGFVPGASLIFATNLKTGQDYHGAMNSTTFESWVKNQLLVGIRNLGSCIIVMDNASYHSREVERQPTWKWRKQEIIAWLQQKGVRVPEQVNKRFLMAATSLHRNKFKRYAVDEMLAEEGHIVLRLPPYHSMFNPIEHVWSIAKGYFNKTVNSVKGEGGVGRAKAVWKDALNEATPEKWKNCVEHTEKLIVEYGEKDLREEEFDECIVSLQHDADTDEEEEFTSEEEPLATPLEPVAGPSTQ